MVTTRNSVSELGLKLPVINKKRDIQVQTFSGLKGVKKSKNYQQKNVFNPSKGTWWGK